MYGTPVIGADIGGIPELIQQDKTGELFESGNKEQLKEKIVSLWKDKERQSAYVEACKTLSFDNLEAYCEKLVNLYRK